MKKFTFKRHVPTGRFRSFEQGSTDIKQCRKVCGQIAERRDGDWAISLSVKDDSRGGGFRWVTLKQKFPNEQEARDHVTPELVSQVLSANNLELFLFED